MRRLILYFVCLLACAPTAWGHAALVAASPAPAAVLQRAPSAIVLTFSEPVGVTALRLFGPDGQQLVTGPVMDHNQEVRISLPGGHAAPGTYLLSWRVTSADGHPVGGTLDYSVGHPSALGSVSQSASPGSLKLAIWLARWLGYLCLFAALGAALFRLIQPLDRQAWVRPAIALGFVLLPVNLGLQGLDMRGASWPALAESATWAQALSSTYASTLGLQALALLAALVALGTARSAILKAAAVAGLGCLGLALTVSGHAGTAPPQWLSRPAVVLHVMMAVVWVGMLVPLARALSRGRVRAAAPAGRVSAAAEPMPLAAFSRWIVPAVALLVLSGLTLARLQLDGPGDLWRTAYGRVLLAKLTLVGLLLCLAAYNRWGLTRAALAGEPAARRRLRAAIRLEVVLAVLILSVVALWRFTPPPRTADMADMAGMARMTAPQPVELADERLRARVTSLADGWHIQLFKPDGAPFEAQGVTLSLSHAAGGIEPLSRAASRQADGSWLAAIPPLSAQASWQITVTVLVDDFDEITLQTAPPVVQERNGS
ncbi:copper resistance CopC/CopD family protein [Castellaniella caeni]|uniref:copper resistance CopC/CopD family protein n=1 Tax=Castellaniella caeni TaxID=266123 RepID=UPI00082E8900|nr:copper resistance protein CopC [Castellaniella caeni]